MKLQTRVYSLDFKHPFGVSSNTRTHTTSVFIRLETSGMFGYGEACIPEYLGEKLEDTLLFFEQARPLIESVEQNFSTEELISKFEQIAEGNNAAKAALDMALFDLEGQIKKLPFYDLVNIGKSEPMSTSFTIGIDKEAKLEQKIIEASDFDILKIKAGTTDDKRLVRQIRKYTSKPLMVDVNQGWKDKHQVINMISWMKEEGVVLIEQPMPVKMQEEMRWVCERSALPLFADESVKRLSDLDNIKGVFSGINIKLMKCTGLSEALKMITWARTNNLQVFLGCMAESSCATSAMAQLMKLADYIDLDAPNLYKNDPFNGVKYLKGKVILNDLPGMGLSLKKELFG